MIPRPMEYIDALSYFRTLLQAPWLGEHALTANQAQSYTLHLKATSGSWARQAGVDELDRLELLHHQKKRKLSLQHEEGSELYEQSERRSVRPTRIRQMQKKPHSNSQDGLLCACSQQGCVPAARNCTGRCFAPPLHTHACSSCSRGPSSSSTQRSHVSR